MNLAKYLSVALASTIKFVGGPLSGLALSLTWYETALFTLAGMMFSVLIFMFLGEAAQTLISRYRKTPPKLFSKRTRLAVRIFKFAGIHGIALLTPILFTPAGGTLLAVSFKINKSSIFFSMLIYGAFWAVVQSYLLFFFFN